MDQIVYEFYAGQMDYEIYLDKIGYELYRNEMNYKIFIHKKGHELYQKSMNDEILYNFINKIVNVKNRRDLYYRRCLDRKIVREWKDKKKIFRNNVKRMQKQYEAETLRKHLGPGNISPRSVMERMIKKHSFMIDYCKKYNLCNEYLELINHLCLFECKPTLTKCIGEFNYDIKKNQERFRKYIIENIDKDWVKNYIDHNKLKYKIE